MSGIACVCGRGTYDPAKYQACYQCALDRDTTSLPCLWCANPHSPSYPACRRCSMRNPDGDEAARHLRLEIAMRDAHTCWYCRRTDVALVVAHLRPIRRNGTADPWNLHTCCRDDFRVHVGQWVPRTAVWNIRVYLMRLYLVFWWQYLDGGQRERLVREARAHAPRATFAAVPRVQPADQRRIVPVCGHCDAAGPSQDYGRCVLCGTPLDRPGARPARAA